MSTDRECDVYFTAGYEYLPIPEAMLTTGFRASLATDTVQTIKFRGMAAGYDE